MNEQNKHTVENGTYFLSANQDKIHRNIEIYNKRDRERARQDNPYHLLNLCFYWIRIE